MAGIKADGGLNVPADKRMKNQNKATTTKDEGPPGGSSSRKRFGRQVRKRQELKKLARHRYEEISLAETNQEKELMSLVFGDKSNIVAQLDKAGEAVPQKVTKVGKKRKHSATVQHEPLERSAVWHDSDDDDNNEASVQLERAQGKNQTYERRRKQFEQIVGQPKWADLDQQRDKASDSEDEMMRKVGHVVPATPAQGLPKGVIQLKKLKNLNRATKKEGHITSINFHPTSMVAIVTGRPGNLSIVTVDGVRNDKLHSIIAQKFHIMCASLSPDGDEVVYGSFRKFFHVYNLISGESQTLKIPPQDTWCMRNFRFSPCGKYLATIGDFGAVHVLSGKGKELLISIQLNAVCTAIAFTPDSRFLLCHSNDIEVSVYDFDKRRLVNVFNDEGCVNGAAIAVCPGGQYVATGSRQGIVNIYLLDAVLESKNPVPLHTISNLTTYIDSVTFNATSELLAIASSTIPNAVKLVHVASGTVFKNFPMISSNLGQVSTVAFSPNGGFLALGNKQSVVSLFRVKHYENY